MKVVARIDRLHQPHRVPVGTVAKVLSVWKGQDAPYQLEGYESSLMEDDDLELVWRPKERN
ncbi:hypothetical protein LPW11_16165 [Geomonas sp. RF6]|uniref:hypothetical protein n=1 Tax=Geomonas sp. RF6 TaxID=2897342 RepID=UPI001E42E3B1|nr:hypothetical protein [Geomonas sp. RF6]UFS69423.1 hypothetical protein LPW11_16165 [Geomonas sp. RF6]